MGNEGYNVVLQYTREAGGYEGVITWTSFRDENHFKKWYSPDIEKRQKAIARGVTPDEAVRLTKQTPIACRVAACFESATDSTGKVNKDCLEMKLRTLAFVMAIDK